MPSSIDKYNKLQLILDHYKIFNINNKIQSTDKITYMKNKKQASINISLGNFINNNTNSRLFLHTRSTNYLANSTKTNRSFQQSSKSKGKYNNCDAKEQKIPHQNIVKESSLSKSKQKPHNKENYPKQSSAKKQQQQTNRNLKNRPTIYTVRQNSLKKQQEGSRNRQQIKSYRKIEISQKQLKKDVRNIEIVDRIQRPHQSQNLRNLQEVKNYDSHKKLYTFCGENKGNRQNTQSKNLNRQTKKSQSKDLYSKNNSQQSINSNINYNSNLNSYSQINGNMNVVSNLDYGSIKSSIIVKQEELKRFTHKFARQKIQFEQTIQVLNEEIQQMRIINKNIQTQKRDIYECLRYKQDEINNLSTKMEELKEHIKGINKIHEQYMRNLHKQLQQKAMIINNMEQQLINKQNKLQQMQLYIQTKQRSYHVQMQRIKQRHEQKLFFPLTNVNHAQSINTDLSNESVNRFSIQFMEELEMLRLQNTRLQHNENENKKALEFLKIQNQHLIKQLDLEKRANFCLKEQILQYKFKLQDQKKAKLQNQSIYEQFVESGEKSASNYNIQSLEAKISELLAQNAALVHNKETLQRSLKVSSQMILCLKQQNTQLKEKWEQMRQLQDTQSQKITHLDVKKIVLMMMKDQLQLEDKIRYLQQGNQGQKQLMNSQNLQKMYERGYQSIKRNKKNDRKSKTEQNESFISNQRNFGTERFLFEEIQNFCH